MAFQDYYVRNCKWCSTRLVIGLCNDDAWRAYEIPPPNHNTWVFHVCPKRNDRESRNREFFRELFNL